MAGQLVDASIAMDPVPMRRPDSSPSSQRVVSGVGLRPGDEIEIWGSPESGEKAKLD